MRAASILGGMVVAAAALATGADEGVRILDPYEGSGGEWYRGQLHMHSASHRSRPDLESIREKVTMYRDAGFDFVCLTDHNFVVLGGEAYTPQPSRDPGVPGIHFISGVEVGFTIRPAGEGLLPRKHHLGGVGMDWTVGRGDSLFRLAETDYSTDQATVDSIRTMRYAEGKEALAILNHPEMASFFDTRIYPSDIARVEGQAGVEVYNTKWAISSAPVARKGVQWAIDSPRGRAWQSHGASHWDFLITHGEGMRWGFATDDAHVYEVGVDFLGGWVKVRAGSLATEPILDAIRAGRFVACVDLCEGAERDNASAEFRELGVRRGAIVAASDRPTEFTWWTAFGHCVRRREGVAADTFRVEGNEGYVRVRIRNDAGAAYSQPFFVESPNRDEDRWQLRPEPRTRLLYHFNEGIGPVAAEARGGECPMLLEWGGVPPTSEWTTLEDAAAYRDSLWGGWQHNGVGTNPDEEDIDRDRWGYALHAWGRSLRGEVPAAPEAPFLFAGDCTIEWIGAVERRGEREQPLIVNEAPGADGRLRGWRIVVTEAGRDEEYLFRLDRSGSPEPVSVPVPGTVPGEVHLLAVTVATEDGVPVVRTYVDGRRTGEQALEGVEPAWRESPGEGAPALTLFADPFVPESGCYYRLRELRISAGARAGTAMADDAERLAFAAGPSGGAR